MEVFFISAHGESQIDSYFVVPPNTFILFNANAGDFGYMRSTDNLWLDPKHYTYNTYNTEENYRNYYNYFNENKDDFLYMRSADNKKHNYMNYYYDSLFGTIYGSTWQNKTLRLSSTQVYVPGDFIPNNRVIFANSANSFRPMGIFSLPLNPDNKLLVDNLWPITNANYSNKSGMYNKLKASSINTSSLPELKEGDAIPTETIDRILAPFTDRPEVVGKSLLLTDVLNYTKTDKKYRFLFLPICRGAPHQYDPGRRAAPSKNTSAYKLLRRMSIHIRKNTCPSDSGDRLNLKQVLEYDEKTYEDMFELGYTYLKETGDQRYFDYIESLPSLRSGYPVNLTMFSFLLAMASHPIPKEFKGTPVETSLKQLTRSFSAFARNISEHLPAKSNTRRLPHQILTNAFGMTETGYTFLPNAPLRINEYGENLGEVFSNAKNAPKHVKIARGNNI